MPCDLFGQVILRPRRRYIQYINIHIYIYIEIHTHRESMHTYNKSGQEVHVTVMCFPYSINNTKVLFQCPLKETLVFSSSFLFSHIFLPSHTFVDVLFCLGQMYVRDQLSVSSFFAAGDFCVIFFPLHCRPVFSLLVFVQHLSVAY